MSRQHHYIKCETKYYQEVERGIKKFELRKNDRDYKVYDIIHLQESVQGVLTGRELPGLEIQYILYGGAYWLFPDHCIINW